MLKIQLEAAGTDLAAMVDAMEQGQEVVIERDGAAVARLVAAPTLPDRSKALAAVEAMREIRRGNVLGPELTVRELIEEGRR